MKSANQLYKDSGSKMPFKKWLKEEQKSGTLKDHEYMFNVTGKTKPSNVNRIKNNNIVGIISVFILAYGLYELNRSEAE